MHNIKLTTYFLLIIFSLSACSVTKDIQVNRMSHSPAANSKTLIYTLPKTVINVRLEMTKTTVKKGPYAEYAKKYLDISNVPLNDSETWSITDVKIWPTTDADQSQYYVINYKTFPDNLNQLFVISNNGLMLDYTSVWKKNLNNTNISGLGRDILFDPNITDAISKEQVDTFYKTIVTDTSFVRIPVFKKQMHIKDVEELAKETAHELIKTRKRKLKLLRGEYDFHPDGKALEVMIKEMEKQEKIYLAMFGGITWTEKQFFTYTFVPQVEKLSKDLCYFSGNEGILDSPMLGGSVVSVQILKDTKESSIPDMIPENIKNALLIRFPVVAAVVVKMDNEKIAEATLPVYQFGSVQMIPLK